MCWWSVYLVKSQRELKDQPNFDVRFTKLSVSRDSFKSNIAKQETKTTTEITTPLPLIFKTTYQLKFVFNDPFCITNINELKLVPTTKPILSFSAIEILLEPLQINER